MKKSGLMAAAALPAACAAVLFSASLRPFLQIQRNEIGSLQALTPKILREGDLTEGVLDNTDGCIAEQTVRNTVYGFSASAHPVSRYYVFSRPDGKLMLYETGRQEEYEQLDRLAEACEQYHAALLETVEKDGRKADLRAVTKPAVTFQASGIIRSMPEDVRRIFSEWYGEAYMGRFSEACETVYLIAQTDYSAVRKKAFVCAACAAAACILIAAAGILYCREKRNQQ